MYKKILLVASLCTGIVAVGVHAAIPAAFNKPFYIGVAGGFGSTTWRGLVPAYEKQSLALNISAPVKVKEGGGVVGVFSGYEITPFFALEVNYRHYPSANVTFDIDSLYAFEHDDRISFDTKTDTVSLMAKVMLVIPRTDARIFSSFGVAGVHRKDEIFDQWQPAPTFGAGFNINITERLMAEIGFNYTAGYGESELNPVNSYVPFLYSGTFGLAYRI